MTLQNNMFMKRKIVFLLVFIVFTDLIISAQEYPCNGIRFEENGRYGLKDKNTGKIILPPEYISIYWSTELAFAWDASYKYGAVDCEGNIVVPFIYDDINGVNESNGIRVKKGNKYGLISPAGKILLDTIYDGIFSYDNYSESASVFYNSEIGIIKMNNKFGLVRKSGEIIYEPVLEDIGRLHNGYVFAKKDGKWGMLDKNAEIIKPYVFEDCKQLWDKGNCAFAKKDGYWALISNEGRELTPFKFDEILQFSFSENIFIVQRDGKYGAINTDGKEICPVQYDEMTSFGYGISMITKEGKHGYINTKGTILLPPEYDQLEDPSNSYFDGWEGGIIKDGKFGLADPKTGKVIIPPQYDKLSVYSDGYYLTASIGENEGLVNRKGKIIVPFEYSSVSMPFGDRVTVQKDGNFGVADTSGNIIVPLIYEQVLAYSEDLLAVKKNGKWGFIDRKGKEKIPCIYEEAFNFGYYEGEKGFARVRKENQWMFIDHEGNTGKAPENWEKQGPGTYFAKGNYSEELAYACKCEYRKKYSDSDDPLSNTDQFFNCRQLFIDKNGQEKFSIPYGLNSGKDKQFEFREGFAMVYKERSWRSGWYGFIDKTGELVIPDIYFSAGPFSEGMAYAAKYPDDSTKLGYEIGYINHDGKYVFTLPPKLSWDNYSGCFYHGMEFSGGKATMHHWENEGDCNRYDSIIIDNTGNVIFGLKYDVSGRVKFCDENAPDPRIFSRNILLWFDENESYPLELNDDGSFFLNAVLPGDLKITYRNIFGKDKEIIITVKDKDIEGFNICTDSVDFSDEELLTKRFMNQHGQILDIYYKNEELNSPEYIKFEMKGKKISAELYVNGEITKKTRINASDASFLVDFEKMLLKIKMKDIYSDSKVKNLLTMNFDGDELMLTDNSCLHPEGLDKLIKELFK